MHFNPSTVTMVDHGVPKLGNRKIAPRTKTALQKTVPPRTPRKLSHRKIISLPGICPLVKKHPSRKLTPSKIFLTENWPWGRLFSKKTNFIEKNVTGKSLPMGACSQKASPRGKLCLKIYSLTPEFLLFKNFVWETPPN